MANAILLTGMIGLAVMGTAFAQSSIEPPPEEVGCAAIVKKLEDGFNPRRLVGEYRLVENGKVITAQKNGERFWNALRADCDRGGRAVNLYLGIWQYSNVKSGKKVITESLEFVAVSRKLARAHVTGAVEVTVGENGSATASFEVVDQFSLRPLARGDARPVSAFFTGIDESRLLDPAYLEGDFSEKFLTNPNLGKLHQWAELSREKPGLIQDGALNLPNPAAPADQTRVNTNNRSMQSKKPVEVRTGKIGTDSTGTRTQTGDTH